MATFKIDLSTIHNDAELEGRQQVPPGRYDALVTSVQEAADSRTPAIDISFLILAGTLPAGVGLAHRERLYTTEKSIKRVALFARRLGLFGPDAFGNKIDIDWNKARGRRAVIEVVEEEFERQDGTKGKGSRMSFAGIWTLDDERVKDVPHAAANAVPSLPPAEDDFSDL